MKVVTTHTDAELIEMARRKDGLAFRELVHRYQSKVAGVVYRMLGPTAEAEDVGQETFIRFYSALPDFRGDAAIGTYLTRIAINLSLNALKKRKRDRREGALVDHAGELRRYGNSEAERRQEARELVDLALARLDPNFRSVIVLRMIEGYSTKETAEILNIPLGTVLSRMKRAQGKLKDILKKLT
ncbi:MAG: sigma-70 family RNA polymerase sigma factor [Bacteroidota bacterium]